MRVVTLVGTRPELIKLSRVIPRLDAMFEHHLVHTGQNYDRELSEVFFSELGIRPPDSVLNCADKSAAATIGNVISQFDDWLASNPVDALLVLGDTNSTLGVIAAKRRRIPVFHMEAGNRCFDERVPEEINRRIVDHMSDINLPYTEHARRYLLAEGIPPDRIIKTGSPQREVIEHFLPNIESSRVLADLELTQARYIVGSLHREENVDRHDRLARMAGLLSDLSEHYSVPIVLSTHPRTQRRLVEGKHVLAKGIRSVPPLGLFDYLRLQTSALCTVSDSGTITEESAILGFPAIMIRDAHERPEGMDEAVVPMIDLMSSTQAAIRAIDHVRQRRANSGRPQMPLDYTADDVSWKVAGIIESYTPYVRRVVWRE